MESDVMLESLRSYMWVKGPKVLGMTKDTDSLVVCVLGLLLSGFASVRAAIKAVLSAVTSLMSLPAQTELHFHFHTPP